MRCPTEKHISLFVDGELPESEAVLLREHIGRCARCRCSVDAMLMLNEAVASMRPDPDMEALARSVKTRVNAEREKPAHGSLLPLWARVSLVAAIVTIAVGLGNVAGTRMTDYYLQSPQEAVLDQLASASNTGFANAVIDFGTQENAQ